MSRDERGDASVRASVNYNDDERDVLSSEQLIFLLPYTFLKILKIRVIREIVCDIVIK